MKKKATETEDKSQNINRKDAIKKIGNYGKYAALTALGTYDIKHTKIAGSKSWTSRRRFRLKTLIRRIKTCAFFILYKRSTLIV